mmetsp:Transcript_14406/g.34116  ORF Transcript_14406/g.34116 Transcript_14406/m.34116 type:complete len:233 (+) Transcript_14406:307-1005(+)
MARRSPRAQSCTTTLFSAALTSKTSRLYPRGTTGSHRPLRLCRPPRKLRLRRGPLTSPTLSLRLQQHRLHLRRRRARGERRRGFTLQTTGQWGRSRSRGARPSRRRSLPGHQGPPLQPRPSRKPTRIRRRLARRWPSRRRRRQPTAPPARPRAHSASSSLRRRPAPPLRPQPRGRRHGPRPGPVPTRSPSRSPPRLRPPPLRRHRALPRRASRKHRLLRPSPAQARTPRPQA